MVEPLFQALEPDGSAFDRAGLAARFRTLANEQIYIGTSSWKYEGWIGQVYSRDRYLTRGRFSRARFEAECHPSARKDSVVLWPTYGVGRLGPKA